jgi:hypothetical protein
VLASIQAQDTETGNVPDWEQGGFASHEEWISFPKQRVGGWVETGQLVGKGLDCCYAHRFFAEETPQHVYHEYDEYPSGVGGKVYNYSALYDVERNGVWHIWWGCPPQTYTWCEVGAYGGGWPVYLTHQEAGIEVGSEYRPVTNGRDEVAASNGGEWWPWSGATYWRGPAGICIARNGQLPAAGNLEFNANC